MLECLIIGDSLAVGVGQARPNCVTLAQTGITSAAYVKTVLPSVPRKAAQIVISLGVNDDPTVPTLDNLRALRREMHGQDVVWLLPGLKDEVRNAILAIAQLNGDRTIDTRPQAGPDRLHPSGTGYRLIAALTQSRSGRQTLSREALNVPIMSRSSPGAIQPNGNLDRYRAAPIVVYPNTYNGRVVYGLPGNTFAALRPPPYQLGTLSRIRSPATP